MPEIIHLHNHSHYSVLDGVMKVDELVARIKEMGHKAVALTDHGNMFGAMEFQKYCKKHGVKPIYGAELYIAPQSRYHKDKTEKYHHLVLLAQNETGYKNLVKLCSIGYLEGFYYKPRIDRDVLREYSDGLIGLSACLGGEIPRMITDGNEAGLSSALDFYTDTFGRDRFFLELQNHALPEERVVGARLIELSRQRGLKLAATADAHYLKREDAKLQEILFAVRDKTVLSDEKRFRYDNDNFFLPTADEMAALFSGAPEALSNTLLINEMCHCDLKPAQHLPIYPLPAGETADSYVALLARQGLAERFKGKDVSSEYSERLEMELALVKKMGFSNYFLIVSDFIRYAKKVGILVGPGRGSAAGALLSYSLSITDVDPMRYSLLFERFLNPERVSMPDIDVDFQDDRRDEVKEYIRSTYGYEKTANIITFGVLKARAALKDVGRVLEIPLEKVNRVTKLIDNKMANEELAVLIFGKKTDREDKKPVAELKELYDNATPQEKEWLDWSIKAEGTIRDLGTHASGVIISDADLSTVVPLYRDAASGLVSTQYEGEFLESNGLLKMDVLGLSNLTMIRDCLNRIRRNHGVELDIFGVPLDDQKVFGLFCRGETNGIFQFESPGMTEYLKRLRPNCIDDLIAMNALYRPGPMDSIPSFIARKQGREAVDCFHPNLEPILKSTYGIIVYQEQVMQIAQVLAGFSLGKADVVRRIMAKKKPEELDKIRPEWVDGSVARGYPKDLAEKIFDILIPFSNYAFNKSHSAAYGILAYQIAYLKAHYPVEFMASLLTLNMSSSDDVKMYCQECVQKDIPVLMPDVNRSIWEFKEEKREGGMAIRFGFGGVKGMGEGIADAVIEERGMGGDFTGFVDFLERMTRHPDFKKSAVEVLLKAGAFDSFIPEADYLKEKSVLLHNVDSLVQQVQKHKSEKSAGQVGLFGDASQNGMDLHFNRTHPPLTQKEDFENEVQAFGFYLSGKLFRHHLERFGRISHVSAAAVDRLNPGSAVLIWGFISELVVKLGFQNRPFAIMTVDNGRDTFRFVLFSDKYEKFKAFLSANTFIMLRVSIAMTKKGRQMDVMEIQPIDRLLKQKFTELHICLNYEEEIPPDIHEQICGMRACSEKEENRGIMRLYFHILHNPETQTIQAGDRYRVRYSEELLDRVAAIPHVAGYWLF